MARRYKTNEGPFGGERKAEARKVRGKGREVRGKEAREIRGGIEKKEKESQRGKGGGSEQVSVWCGCGQRRQQVRHGSVINNTRV